MKYWRVQARTPGNWERGNLKLSFWRSCWGWEWAKYKIRTRAVTARWSEGHLHGVEIIKIHEEGCIGECDSKIFEELEKKAMRCRDDFTQNRRCMAVR